MDVEVSSDSLAGCDRQGLTSTLLMTCLPKMHIQYTGDTHTVRESA
jgi:hypothetical protein